jgi:Rrf2 family protein
MTLRLSRKTDYALVALGHLAQKEASAGHAVSAREVADAYAMPRALVIKLLKQMNRGGLVDATRGVNGGYFLARPADQISVADVAAAIEGPVRVAWCCNDDPDDPCPTCHVVGKCPIGLAIRQLSDRFHAQLQATTLADLLAGQLPPLSDQRYATRGKAPPGRLYELSVTGADAALP